MNPSQAVVAWSLDNTSTLPIAEFARQCHDRMTNGAQLVSLWGRPAATHEVPGIVVNAVLQTANAPLALLRGHATQGEVYPALTTDFAAAQIFERELWEQTGLVPQGHPWLKPVRFEGAHQEHMGDYPFFSVRGKEVHEVGVGPIHAGVIEPGHFRFMCHGEKVHHLEIQLGYQHRAVEHLLLRRPVWQLTPLVESICGDSCIAYAWSYCAALEHLGQQPVDSATELSRAVGLEMERIAIHTATLGGMATDIAFLQGGSTYGRLRTAIINASQRVCGNRFGRGWLRPGTARPIDEALRKDLIHTLQAFAIDFAEINTLMLASSSVKARLQDTGTLSPRAARELGLSGVAARASGMAHDARTLWPAGAYQAFPLPMITEPQGDCAARMRVRMRETQASVSWLLARLQDTAINLCAPTPANNPAQPAPLQANTLCVSVVEGVRGAVVHMLETDNQGTLVHYKVQDPSLTNWFGVAQAVRNNGISDFPICNKSFDLSYCGNDL